ncbi:hypothetical protein GUITHDRAFT_100748 [Guillardia theta CCMP2712]|uniref:Glycine amidinotransferase, mitochondrial n=2 Tax=Guillardia theta TaxID=55529 RepID=L1K0A5_GUITC|nr:hypothetical protein GUITHDRAFT_100748 [Guillardia theta CCMP2712]EKX53778.1 hypothetical protein GUITHDRAFT_100748 [Guillardia theta CCMP2712]|eukprot:XP_005840758.1 hypothetical protein GUITHDRAFT_100748 [Guillardia theta CCMP2712]
MSENDHPHAPKKTKTTAPVSAFRKSLGNEKGLVNSWNEWDTLEEIIVGIADKAVIPPKEPAFEMKVKDSGKIHMLEGTGYRTEQSIKMANDQLNYFVELLEGEGVVVRRPDVVDFNVPVKTPDWEVPRMNTSACPRDLLLTLGNEVIEATMSWRSRFFEYRPYRGILKDYMKRDPCMLWTCAPKPLMADNLYRSDYPTDYSAKNKELVRNYIYLTSEEEPIFDAADIMRFGKDIFVHMGFTTNEFGFEWLRRHCASRGMRAHMLHFPDDLCPFHCDATFVPLRPYLALENPARPMEPFERRIFEENDWKLITAAQPNTMEMPALSQCSPWLCMNVLSLSEKVIFCEETEKEMMNLFNDYGFDTIPVPFRNVFEFGGSFHCVTTDIRRRGKKQSYFKALDAQEAAAQ